MPGAIRLRRILTLLTPSSASGVYFPKAGLK
jgi:hypothetical protein